MNLYVLLPLLSAICTFFLGLFVLIKNQKEKLNRVFFLFTFFVTVWLAGTAILLSNCHNLERAIFWDRFVYLGVIFIPPTCLHFSNLLIKGKRQNFLIISSYCLSIFFFLISRTDFFIFSLIKYPWGCHTRAGLFHDLFLLNFAVFIIFVFINLIRGLKKVKSIEKVQIKYVLVAFVMLGVGALGFLSAYGLNIYPFAYLCGLVAVVIIAYAIIKHHLMNVKVITTEIFSVLISVILLIDALLSETQTEFILKFGLFLGIAVFSALLIRGVLNEVKSRERIAKMALTLERANIELKKLDKAKSEFISIASHQLRTPLSVIKSFLSMILEDFYGSIPDSVRDKMKKSMESNERLIRLVDDLLDLSHMERGKMKFDFKKVSFQKVVESVFEEMEPQAKSKGLQFIYHRPQKHDFMIKADDEKLRQVITNLMDNAIKYTEKGKIEVRLKRTDHEIVFSIKDMGIGILPEEKKYLFKRFVRGKKVSRLWTEGVGLGLYVARLIVEAHHGQIGAESQGEDKGSEFWVKLPVEG